MSESLARGRAGAAKLSLDGVVSIGKNSATPPLQSTEKGPRPALTGRSRPGGRARGAGVRASRARLPACLESLIAQSLQPMTLDTMQGMKSLILTIIIALGTTVASAQSDNTPLMTPADYKHFLDTVEHTLPGVESALRTIDPAKTSASYATGTQIVRFRDLTLKQIGWALEVVAKERAKHTVSGEFALQGFLRGVFDNLDTIGQFELPVGVNTTSTDKYAPVLSSIVIRISNDLARRIELLEKGTCS